MNYNDETLLEMVELYAEDNRLISSEEELSERFDNLIAPIVLEIHGQRGVEFDDVTMMNEAFNNWSDELREGGEIHPEQYSAYEYVGRWS